jgi:hypothetical protein
MAAKTSDLSFDGIDIDRLLSEAEARLSGQNQTAVAATRIPDKSRTAESIPSKKNTVSRLKAVVPETEPKQLSVRIPQVAKPKKVGSFQASSLYLFCDENISQSQ